MLHRLYLAPGMFGFGKLATYSYFAHVENALKQRFSDAGHTLVTHVVDVAPTASIRRRAIRLAELVAKTASEEGEEDGPIHLLGHSTGGLDARLLASPSVKVATAVENLGWMKSRLKTVTTMNTPHFGTPMASFFATVSGQRMLYAVSALTFIGLSLGAPPLTAASALVVAIGRLDKSLGVELRVLDRTTDMLLKALEPASSKEVRLYLDAIRRDQGAVIQLTPEAMDLFQAGIEDRPDVYYQSTAAMAPAPSASGVARSLTSAWGAISGAIFTAMYGITSRYDERYPCGENHLAKDVEEKLTRAFGSVPGPRASDGVVPITSQVWGDLVWTGYGDHLDVLGHFGATTEEKSLLSRLRFPRKSEGSGATRAKAGTEDGAGVARHVDWLRSGSAFDEAAFGNLMDAIAKGMLSR